jgi:hypothetical protein
MREIEPVKPATRTMSCGRAALLLGLVAGGAMSCQPERTELTPADDLVATEVQSLSSMWSVDVVNDCQSYGCVYNPSNGQWKYVFADEND